MEEKKFVAFAKAHFEGNEERAKSIPLLPFFYPLTAPEATPLIIYFWQER